jgi:hypothetical protein
MVIVASRDLHATWFHGATSLATRKANVQCTEIHSSIKLSSYQAIKPSWRRPGGLGRLLSIYLSICISISSIVTPGAPHASPPRSRPACPSNAWQLRWDRRPREWASARVLPRGVLSTSRVPLLSTPRGVWCPHRPLCSHCHRCHHTVRRKGYQRTRPDRDGSPPRMCRHRARTTHAQFAAAVPRLA